MEMEKSDPHELKPIREEIRQLKNRINLIEAVLDIQEWKSTQPATAVPEQPEDDFELNFTSESGNSVEFRMGEYGMAWLGNIVLLFGIAFLVQYLQNSGYPLFAALTGFVSVAAIYAGCYFTRTAYAYLSKLFEYTGHLLVFFMVLWLHFFQSEPLIKNNTVALAILIATLGVLFYLSFRRKSQLMAGMVLIMILISGIISNSVRVAPAMTSIAALLAVVLYYRFGWLKLVFAFIFLIWLAHLNWLLNNPFGGNNPEFIPSPGTGYLYLLACGFIFSLPALIPKKENISDEFLITAVIWNGLGFSALLALTSVTYLSNNYVPVFAAISVFCLAYAIILRSKSTLKILASIYALYGFLAMSVSFYGIMQLPEAYMLLAIQSLLVVSMALWFRSRFIVVMNTILFALLLAFYLTDESRFNSINFAFMLVAFVTARVINWKKERLKIKTELIRNLYLIFGFTMTLIAFSHVFPSSFISVSWIIAAILFFMAGRLIKNIKYRWLAIASLVAAAFRLILIDMSNVDIGFRVLVFLFMAIISIAVSVLYTKYLIKKKE